MNLLPGRVFNVVGNRMEDLPQEEVRLRLRTREGDREAFAALIGRHRARVETFLYRLLGDRQKAEDDAQEVFLRLWLARHRYEPRAPFTTFLYQVARDHSLNEARKRRSRPIEVDAAEIASDSERADPGEGAGVVVRLVDRSTASLGMEELGLAAKARTRVEAMIAHPGGLLLTTGPTGAGKSTFLYSILNRLNRPEIKIVTVEEPVKLDLPGMNQLAVHRRAGVTHATGMRALLRQDPDIIMVSNIPQMETLDLCMGAALTGHLVLSCMHTRDATEAIVRLMDVGAAPFMVAGTLIGVIGQRLVRRVCDACKESYTPEEETLKKLGFTPETRPAAFTRGAGCGACEGIGYRGRIGPFEVLTITEDVAQGIVERAAESRLRDQALAEGALIPFLDDARAKIAEGITTVEEVAGRLISVVPAGR
jgi:RNA polymerase sigma factor (sigma-70 family)